MATARLKRQFRGTRRHQLNKLIHALTSLNAWDDRARLQAARDSTVPLLFSATPQITGAITTLLGVAQAALDAVG